LSAQGEERAQGLQVTFGKDSSYNIGCIIAEHPKKSITPQAVLSGCDAEE
jgi:hypothetical protein